MNWNTLSRVGSVVWASRVLPLTVFLLAGFDPPPLRGISQSARVFVLTARVTWLTVPTSLAVIELPEKVRLGDCRYS